MREPEGREQDIMTTSTTRTRKMQQALTLAAEYARLSRAGRLPEADQAARTIDDLVGRRTAAGRWTLPPAVRRVMAGDAQQEA